MPMSTIWKERKAEWIRRSFSPAQVTHKCDRCRWHSELLLLLAGNVRNIQVSGSDLERSEIVVIEAEMRKQQRPDNFVLSCKVNNDVGASSTNF